MTSWTNWAGTEWAQPRRTVAVGSTEDVVAAVRAAVADGLRVKPLGAGHSFTGAAVTDGLHLDLTGLSGLVGVDQGSGVVTVRGGTRLHELNPVLLRHGLALPNLGDIDQQSITGAIATGTHGTGARLGGLASQ